MSRSISKGPFIDDHLQKKICGAYDSFEFHAIFHGLLNFCTVTMSAFYLDIIKDRLYTSAPDSADRRAAQTVLYDLADSILRLMAPVLVFTAAEAWDHRDDPSHSRHALRRGIPPRGQ